MSFLNPDKMFASLVNAMGLKPDQIQTFVTELVTELRVMKAEREAFKPAASRAYADVTDRLARVENKIDALMMLLHARGVSISPPKPNGASHVGNPDAAGSNLGGSGSE
jgi:hypothetical protein